MDVDDLTPGQRAYLALTAAFYVTDRTDYEDVFMAARYDIVSYIEFQRAREILMVIQGVREVARAVCARVD